MVLPSEPPAPPAVWQPTIFLEKGYKRGQSHPLPKTPKQKKQKEDSPAGMLAGIMDPAGATLATGAPSKPAIWKPPPEVSGEPLMKARFFDPGHEAKGADGKMWRVVVSAKVNAKGGGFEWERCPEGGDKPKNWAAFNAPPVLLAPTSELVPMDPQPYQPPQPPRPPTPPTPPYPSGAPEPQMPLPPEQLVQRLEPLAQPQHPQFQLAGDTIVYYPPQPPMTGQLVPAPPHRPELTERAVQKQLERYRKQLERRRASEAADGCAGCEKNPLCTRGYRHGGLGGSCSTKPPRKKPYSAASIAAATALKPYSATNLAAIARENTQAMVDVVLSAAKEAKEGEAKLAAAKEANEGEAKPTEEQQATKWTWNPLPVRQEQVVELDEEVEEAEQGEKGEQGEKAEGEDRLAALREKAYSMPDGRGMVTSPMGGSQDFVCWCGRVFGSENGLLVHQTRWCIGAAEEAEPMSAEMLNRRPEPESTWVPFPDMARRKPKRIRNDRKWRPGEQTPEREYEDEDIEPPANSDAYTCDRCGKVIMNKGGLATHVKHCPPLSIEEKDARGHEADFREAQLRQALRQTLQGPGEMQEEEESADDGAVHDAMNMVVNDVLDCDLCGKSCLSMQALSSHKKWCTGPKQAPLARDFVCEHCNRGFTTAWALRTHISRWCSASAAVRNYPMNFLDSLAAVATMEEINNTQFVDVSSPQGHYFPRDYSTPQGQKPQYYRDPRDLYPSTRDANERIYRDAGTAYVEPWAKQIRAPAAGSEPEETRRCFQCEKTFKSSWALRTHRSRWCPFSAADAIAGATGGEAVAEEVAAMVQPFVLPEEVESLSAAAQKVESLILPSVANEPPKFMVRCVDGNHAIVERTLLLATPALQRLLSIFYEECAGGEVPYSGDSSTPSSATTPITTPPPSAPAPATAPIAPPPPPTVLEINNTQFVDVPQPRLMRNSHGVHEVMHGDEGAPLPQVLQPPPVTTTFSPPSITTTFSATTGQPVLVQHPHMKLSMGNMLGVFSPAMPF